MGELVLTPAGYDGLVAELERLRTVDRPAVRERLQQALAFAGDLGDEPEYLEAVHERDVLEHRIALLEERLSSATVLEPDDSTPATVTIGCWAELEDLDAGGFSRYVIVSSPEANPSQGRLSVESPVGRMVLGHRPGETVEVVTPRGRRRLRIVAAGRG